MEELSTFINKQDQELRRENEKGEEEAMRRKREWEAVAPLCPDCGFPLIPPRLIRRRKGPGNIHGWTCHWFCSSETCLYEKYTHEDAREEMKKIMERRMK